MDDTISRQGAIDALIDRFADEDCPNIEYFVYWDHGMVIDTLKKVPSAQPKKGKWIGADYDGDIGIYVCDQCGKFAMMKSDFCPNCGADMRGEQHE